MANVLSRIFLGRRKDIRDPGIYHRMALIPFLAWVGLGADGLSSSAYGPEEAFRALGAHTYLAVALALATAVTVLVISWSYSSIIEQFPAGGGGYLVATQLLGSRVGVVSGSALLVDYVLTITVSVASGVDAIFSFLPHPWIVHRFQTEVAVLILLTVVNLRGVKESVLALTPFFLIFLVTHTILIGGGLVLHAHELPAVAHQVKDGFHDGLTTLGLGGMALLFFRAYSLGGGTYTGIEAVSNGLSLMREPRVETGKRTMVYMAISLALVAGGILLAYLLFDVQHVEGKTMNAVLAESLGGHWHLGPIPIGKVFVITTLFAEAVLLFVAAQAGFIGGPRVLANMAADSWLPHRLSALSDRLTTQNGVLLMGSAALAALFYTGGHVSTLVVMYSINVFLTFLLSEAGMVRFFTKHRAEHPNWKGQTVLFSIGFVMCAVILVVVVLEKFIEGGWVTLLVTTALVVLCFLIRRHYGSVRRSLSHLDALFRDLPLSSHREELGPVDPTKPTAVLLSGNYGGLGVHSVLTLLRMFPNHFANMVFVSVGVIDSGNFKGASEVDKLKSQTRDSLGQYVGLARRLGLSAEYRMSVGTDIVDEASKLCLDVAKEFANVMFFSGKLIFEERKWYHRILHNETAYAIQHRLQFAGYPMVILPVRVRASELKHHRRDRSNPKAKSKPAA
ncbi:MAG: amino acid transporter-like protein [Myxococcales bacterium]|nr:amino acid transporter-like protein [Myxococcales bacterium]